jgi:hypothetical protein
VFVLVDATIGKSIEGAEVVLTAYSFPQNEEGIETAKGRSNGSSLIPAGQGWGLYMAPLDAAPLNAKILSRQTSTDSSLGLLYRYNGVRPLTCSRRLLERSE